MGVPVVTLVGDRVVGRAGLSQARQLELAELVANHADEFVEIAVRLARDLPRLAALRSELRARLAASPLMDAPSFVRDLERAYRQAWQKFCAEPVA
jgi:predicted O-linked N-acetylglucosamine transferase (SPINDLY family)